MHTTWVNFFLHKPNYQIFSYKHPFPNKRPLLFWYLFSKLFSVLKASSCDCIFIDKILFSMLHIIDLRKKLTLNIYNTHIPLNHLFSWGITFCDSSKTGYFHWPIICRSQKCFHKDITWNLYSLTFDFEVHLINEIHEKLVPHVNEWFCSIPCKPYTNSTVFLKKLKFKITWS